jgi:hypothetical protein
MADAIEQSIERRKIERQAVDRGQAVVTQAQGELAVVAGHDPGIAAKAEVENGRASRAQLNRLS